MIKFALIAATAVLMAVPAMAQQAPTKPAGCTARSNDLNCYNGFGQQAQPSTSVGRTQPAVPTSSFREPTAPSLTNVVVATQLRDVALQQCLGTYRSNTNKQAWNQAGQQIGVTIADGLTNKAFGSSNSYYNPPPFRHQNNYRNNDRICASMAQQVYNDAIRAQPRSYCDISQEVMVDRNGQVIGEDVAKRRCQSRQSDSTWSAGFQQPGK